MLKNIIMTDLHCHILPYMDDGAKDTDEAIQLIKEEYNQGVTQLVFTSHFDCEKMSLNDYILKRNKIYNNLCLSLKKQPELERSITIKLAAEVLFSPNLNNLDISKLCITGTSFLLIELPRNNLPFYFEETISNIQMQGIIPIVAHIERYQYVMNNLLTLYEWVERDILIQVNSNTLINNGKKAKKCLKLIQWNLIHVVASDTHSIKHRPPQLLESLNIIKNKLGLNFQIKMCENANSIFNGLAPNIDYIYKPKRILGRWY